ncbi:MAG TPA: hypothetical protein DCG69_03865 [Bacteroidales bacterium]|nr:hypothetical protein [Bacteroidales bacterium]
MKQKLASLILLFILITPVIFAFLWFSYQKSKIQHEVKEQLIAGIDKSKLHRFEFELNEAKSKVKWKNPHEFEYQNQMYDIVFTESLNTKIVYWCWNDQKETELHKQIKLLVDQAMGTNSQNEKQQTHLNTFFKSLYCQHHILPKFDSPLAGKWIFFETKTSFSIFSIAPPFPPPKGC